MRMEIRLCKQCYEGTHDNPEKTAITRDMVSYAETIREYKDLIGLDQLYITRVSEGEPGGGESLPAVAASIENDRIVLTDTQLTMEDDDGNMLVYSEPEDILEILSRNLDQINERTRQDVSVEVSEESASILGI
ncbi:hypothetical protein ACERIT_13650 [Halopenitus sp. H-Gu1]|uniref:hypothetical protein n=1 Tax=Halopenitus sp. H-Gu1 TaxID=3242697 RepID=UPI00359EBE0F